MPNVIDLGKQIKAKHPGVFDDLSDIELGSKVKSRFPQEFADFEGLPEETKKINKAVPVSLTSKAFDFGEKALNIASDPMTKKVYGPLARKLPFVDDFTKAKIQALEGKKDVVYPSDILEEVAPIFKAESMLSNAPFITPQGFTVKGIPRVAAKTAVDAVLDPLSWFTGGQKTSLGKLVSTVTAMKKTGDAIKLDSKVARLIAKEMKAAKPSANIIRQFVKKHANPGRTITQEMLNKERSLLSVSLPFTETNIPLLTGKPAAALTKPFDVAGKLKATKFIEHRIRDIFSTKSGIPELDRLMDEARDVAHYRSGLEVDEGKTLNKKLDSISRGSGIPRDELNRKLTAIGEEAIRKNPTRYVQEVLNKLDGHYNDKLVDAKVALYNAKKVGNQPAVEKATRDLATYQGALNELHGKYSPPPNVSPEELAVIRENKARYANQLFREQVSGTGGLPLLADIHYIPHILTTDALEARFKWLKSQNKLPDKMSQKKFNEEVANHVRREFNQLKPEVVNAWADVGLISRREAKAVLNKKPLSVVTRDKFGNKFNNTIPNGLEMMDDLLKRGKITEAQFTDAVHSLTVDEVNALGRSGKLNNMFGGYKGDIFHTDPVYTSTVRGMRGETARTYTEFYQKMIKQGLAVPEGKADPTWVPVKQPELEGYHVEPDAARVMNKLYEFDQNPEEWRKVWKGYDKFHRWSKAWTLGVFPAYHTMNAVGNFWNNFLAGVTNPDVYRQAAMVKSKQKFGKGAVNFIDDFGNKWNSDKIMDEARKRGVVGQGQYSGEAQKTLKEILEQDKWRVSDFITPSTRNRVLRGGLWFGRQVEENSRLAHFIDRLRKGDTPDQAASSVKKFLFDYGDLTHTEKQYQNRAFFFYTWLRKNIPLQLQSLVQTPGKMGVPYKLRHEMEKETPEAKERYLYENIKENFGTRVRYDPKTKQATYFMFNKWIPAADIVKVVHLHELALQSLAPLSKEFLQELYNQDFYTHKQIQEYKGQKERILGRDLPVRIVHGMKLVRMLNEVDKLTKDDADMLTKIMGIMTGKVQTFDLAQGVVANKARVDKDVQTLTNALIRKKMENKRYQDTGRRPLSPDQLNNIEMLIKSKGKEY